MASYYLNEAALDLPERPFVDKTIHGLQCKLPSGKTLGVLIHRRPAEPGRSLQDVVREHVAVNQKRLLGYAVLNEAGTEIGGVPARLLETRFRRDAASFYQAQVHVLSAGKAMIFAVCGPIEERALCDETLGRLLATFAWRVD